MKKLALLGVLAVGSGATNATAYEIRCRFVERIGSTDVVLPNNTLFVQSSDLPHNIRIQFGVFDDAAGPAPDGGYIGWNNGTMTVSGPVNNSDERRNPGRLAPWNFSTNPNANGNPLAPAGDPFTMLTQIDNTIGLQSPLWVCNPDGTVPPQPAAVVRGRNTFVSTFAISVDPIDGPSFQPYSVTIGGNVQAASAWFLPGNPSPPDCGDPSDPSDDIAGNLTYVPFPTPPIAFSCVLNVAIPAPGTGVLLGLGGVMVARRRR